MSRRLLALSERWFRLLVRLYPVDFRDDMGQSVVEAYRDRARAAYAQRGIAGITVVWWRALVDAVRNGPGERANPAVSWRRTGQWARDAEFAMRRLRRSPGLLVGVAATLMVGLGMFAVVYTVVQKILIAPMPYKDPDGLYFVWRDYGPIIDLKRGALSGTDVAELQKAGGVIESAAAVSRVQVTFAAREGADAAEIAVLQTTPNLFDVLGVSPALGRGFAPDEGGPNRRPTVVLTYDLWNRTGADPSIIGRNVRLNGETATVIGVLPRGFSFVRSGTAGAEQRVDAYMTLAVDLAQTNPGAGAYGGLIRVSPGTPPQTAASAVDRVGRLVDTRDFKGRGLRLHAIGLQRDLVSAIRPALVVLAFAGLFLLLILMVNLASVLVARAGQREQEVALSRALGANTAAIARATLFEGGILGLFGGVAGTLVAVWATHSLMALAPVTLPRRENVEVDWSIAAVVIAVGVLLGLLAATPPAVWAARAPLGTLLARTAVRGGGGGTGRARRVLVVAQVALTLILLTTGGLVVRSFERLLRADPGFRAEGLLTFRVPMPAQFYAAAPDAIAVQDRIEHTIRALPGVSGVSGTTALPLRATAVQRGTAFPGAPGNTGAREKDRPLVDAIGVRAGYAEVLGMRVVAGRPFEPARREGVQEALIDRQLARQFFPTGSPLGHRLLLGGSTLTIVGVVEQARLYKVHEDGRPQVYLRAEDSGVRTLNYVVRSSRTPESLIPEVRGAIRAIDSRLAVSEERTMEQILDDATREQRLSALSIGGFALGALMLAAMGLFGVVAGAVTRRRHEFAVRLALGADHRRLMRMVLSDGARLVGVGLLIGIPGIYAASGLIRSVLVGVSPADPLTLAGVACGLTAVTMLACYLPARRVLRLEAARSLRQE